MASRGQEAVCRTRKHGKSAELDNVLKKVDSRRLHKKRHNVDMTDEAVLKACGNRLSQVLCREGSIRILMMHHHNKSDSGWPDDFQTWLTQAPRGLMPSSKSKPRIWALCSLPRYKVVQVNTSLLLGICRLCRLSTLQACSWWSLPLCRMTTGSTKVTNHRQ